MSWTPITGRALGMSLLASFDLSALALADWTGVGSVALTPDDGGNVVSDVTVTINNAAGAATLGPDGVTGVVIEPTDAVVQYNEATRDAPFISIDHTELLTPTKHTVVACVIEMAGDAPAEIGHEVILGMASGNFYSFVDCTFLAGAVTLRTSRILNPATRNNADDARALDWIAHRLSAEQGTTWGGESPAPAHLSATDFHTGWSFDASPGAPAGNFVAGSEWRIVAAATGAAATFAPIITRMSFYEIVP